LKPENNAIPDLETSPEFLAVMTTVNTRTSTPNVEDQPDPATKSQDAKEAQEPDFADHPKSRDPMLLAIFPQPSEEFAMVKDNANKLYNNINQNHFFIKKSLY